MQLRTYLKEYNIKTSEFARRLGVTRATVWNWMAGEEFPNPRNMYKVEKVTDGEVTIIDMMEMYRERGKGQVRVEVVPKKADGVPSAW